MKMKDKNVWNIRIRIDTTVPYLIAKTISHIYEDYSLSLNSKLPINRLHDTTLHIRICCC